MATSVASVLEQVACTYRQQGATTPGVYILLPQLMSIHAYGLHIYTCTCMLSVMLITMSTFIGMVGTSPSAFHSPRGATQVSDWYNFKL